VIVNKSLKRGRVSDMGAGETPGRRTAEASRSSVADNEAGGGDMAVPRKRPRGA